MPRVVKLLIMIFFSFVVALFTTRSGDPLTLYVNTVAILCIVVPSYLVGLREGRVETGIAGKNTTQDAANKE
jgi:hypothetical protein